MLATLIYCPAANGKPSLIDELGDRLTDELFFEPAHRTIWRHVRAIHLKGGAADYGLLYARLDREGTLEGIGGPPALSEVTTGRWALPSRIGYHLNELEIYEKQRLAISETSAIAALAQSGDTEEAQKRAAAMLIQLRGDKARGATRMAREVMMDVIDELELAHANKGVSPYPSTGLPRLDEILGGIVPGHVIVIGARTSHGKSAFALHLVRQLSKAGLISMIFSLEMSPRRLMQRMIAAESGVSLGIMRQGRMNEVQLDRVSAATKSFPPDRIIFVEDAGSMHAGQMIAEIRRAREKHPGLALVVIDYIQQVTPAPGIDKGANREQQVASVSRSFQVLAQSLDITILILSQLNEAGAVRESRAISFDADVVLTLILEDAVEGNPQRNAVLNVDKNKDGESGMSVNLSFNGSLQRFNQMEKDEQ